ncbi:1-acyl-sn-glycerol-3-phosphate acyltransferase [Ruminococcaceae bacterium OttesenSCG-928-L11]|nr:1-acyl-sn-glycerol-3-phosphate acyltransferase [Ruminococcaceae bacterium OttesenSCG-928-L11]
MIEAVARKKPNKLLAGIAWGASAAITAHHGLRIQKAGLNGTKPPYLILSNHQSFTDYYVAYRVVGRPYASFVADIESFIGLEQPCRWLGVIGTRKFTNDISLVRNILHAVRVNKTSVVLYPEARYCNMGTTCALPPSVGKLAKQLGVPVVMLKMRGTHLMAPFWNTRKRKVPLEAEYSLLLNEEQVQALSADEMNRQITDSFAYDEYRWQQENRIRIDEPWRAEGLHRALYWCPACGSEYQMDSDGAHLFCTECGKRWVLTEYGSLLALSGDTEFSHPPDWYEHQRELVRSEIEAGTYAVQTPVRVESLPGGGGFIDLGMGELTHSMDGFTLHFSENGKLRIVHIPPSSMYSLHNEYDFKGKGMGLSLSTLDESWYLYTKSPECNTTKMMFATEELYRYIKEKNEFDTIDEIDSSS